MIVYFHGRHVLNLEKEPNSKAKLHVKFGVRFKVHQRYHFAECAKPVFQEQKFNATGIRRPNLFSFFSR